MKKFAVRHFSRITRMAWLIIATLAMSPLFYSCADKAKDAKQTEKSITVILASILNPKLTNPATADVAMILYEMVYEPLVRYGMGGKIESGLAESWAVGEDGRTLTFNLRKEVKFSDGTDFSADSVVAATKRWNTRFFSSPIEKVEKKDDYTVSFVFQTSSYPVLTELTYPRPVRIPAPSAFDKDGKFVFPVGTGRWMIESYVEDEEVILVPNPYYYGEKPKLDKITLRSVKDGQSRLMALMSGEADFSIEDLPAEAVTVIAGSKHLVNLEVPGTLEFFLIQNEENKPLQDIAVRRAINYAINKESIVQNIMNGAAAAGKGIFPETVPYVTSKNSPGYAYDLEMAKSLLAGAGYIDSDNDGIVEKDGKPLTFKLTFQAEEWASWKTICEFIQAELAKAGIGIKLEQLESSAYYDAIWENRDFDLVIYRTYEDSWSPHGFIRQMFSVRNDEKAVCWTDPVLSKMIVTVLASQDETSRQEGWDSIFTRIHENAYTVPICVPNKTYTYNKRLKNVKAASTSYESALWHLIDLE